LVNTFPAFVLATLCGDFLHFGGCALFAYFLFTLFSEPRRYGLFSDKLAAFTVFGVGDGYCIGRHYFCQWVLTSSKEYAELEMAKSNILLALVWSAYVVKLFGTMLIRKVSIS